MEQIRILGDKVRLFRRAKDGNWYAETFLGGSTRRKTTKEKSLSLAKEVAEDWYLTLRGKLRDGILVNERIFNEAADKFEKEYEVITNGQRNKKHVKDHKTRIRLHLAPFFGNKGLSEITAGAVQEYRTERLNPSDHTKHIPSQSTLHKEIVTLRQVLKTAIRHGWLKHLPDMSTPYGTSGKVSHRAWFSHEEYKELYEATRKNCRVAKGKPWQFAAEQLHDYVLFMANTGIRPDEANRLEYRDVTIIEDEATQETILEIVVRGKRGVGYCKSTNGAVRPFQRLQKRNLPEPTDRLFPANHKKQFNRILEETNLKFDREGSRRTTYSLRHTYICFRLLEGADIYQIAKNCRTSVEMIEKHYARHIKTNLDAAAINVRKNAVVPK